MWARIISGIIGIFMLFNAFNWILDPAAAAESLSMTLLEGKGGNTQIGDFTSFFFTGKHFNFLSTPLYKTLTF